MAHTHLFDSRMLLFLKDNLINFIYDVEIFLSFIFDFVGVRIVL